MKKADAIPSSQVPVLKLKCYHMSLHTSTPLVPEPEGAFSVFHSFDLIDPAEGVAELLQAWLAERDETINPTLRHLEIEDRHGVHRFPDQRCGDIFVFCEDSVAFESFTDSDSVLPDPVKPKRKRSVPA
ncbi:TPA: hypothetical protein QDB04_002920 [Burkholderia vietnamiensis]|jgi:hypothetical protein|nr:hypothetical protein [Burkholderia vietnamiensis]